jgi:hypothetical protein
VLELSCLLVPAAYQPAQLPAPAVIPAKAGIHYDSQIILMVALQNLSTEFEYPNVSMTGMVEATRRAGFPLSRE